MQSFKILPLAIQDIQKHLCLKFEIYWFVLKVKKYLVFAINLGFLGLIKFLFLLTDWTIKLKPTDIF